MKSVQTTKKTMKSVEMTVRGKATTMVKAGMKLALSAMLMGGQAFAATPAAVKSEGPAAVAPAAPTNPPAGDPATDPVGQLSRFSLADLGFGESLRQHDTRSTLTLPLPTRSDHVLVGATLELQSAASLDPSVAALEVLVGGERVALIDAKTLASKRSHTVAIAPALLESQNSFALKVITSQAGVCVGSAPAGAWQVLDGGTLELRSTPLRLPNELGILPLPFYDTGFDHLGRAPRIPVVFLHAPTARDLRAMSIVASWLGIRGEGAAFEVSVGKLPAGHALVLAEGASDASALGLPPPAGAGLRMMDNPQSSDHMSKLLVISGRDGDDVTAAALALAEGGALKGESLLVGARPQPPLAAPYAAPRWLAARDVIPLDGIPGGKELVHRGATGATMKLSFRLPPDLFFWLTQNPALELSYDEQLGVGIKPPKVNVELNGHFLATLPPPKSRAGAAWGRVRLPVNRDHLAGYNELVIHLDYGAQGCAGEAGGGTTRFTVDGGGSSFRFTGQTHFANLPDLSLFVHDGFPFTRRPDLGEALAVLSDRPQPAEIASLLSLVAGFAAVTGQPATGLEVTTVSALPRDPGRDLLVVGAADNQPLLQTFAAHLPLQAAPGRATARQPADSLLGWARLAMAGRLFDGELARADEVLDHLPRYAAVTAIESPLDAGRSVVFVTAGQADDMPTLASLQGRADSRYRGGDLLVSAGEERWMFRLGLGYQQGHLAPWHAFLWLMSQHWVGLFPAAALGIVLMALVLRLALRGRVRRRLLEIGEAAR